MSAKDTYPIFLECCEYLNTEFWLEIFKNMAKGKMPYGIHVSGKTLVTHYKNKDFTYKYEGKDAEVIALELKDMFVNQFGLRSDLDNKKYTVKLADNLEYITKNRENVWKSIKRHSIKRILIVNYIIVMKKEYNLDFLTSLKLRLDIDVGLTDKTLTSDDITLNTGVIQEINRITFTDNNYTINYRPMPKKKVTTKGVRMMVDYWILNKSKKGD
jgi:hypothetical protein